MALTKASGNSGVLWACPIDRTQKKLLLLGLSDVGGPGRLVAAAGRNGRLFSQVMPAVIGDMIVDAIGCCGICDFFFAYSSIAHRSARALLAWKPASLADTRNSVYWGVGGVRQQ